LINPCPKNCQTFLHLRVYDIEVLDNFLEKEPNPISCGHEDTDSCPYQLEMILQKSKLKMFLLKVKSYGGLLHAEFRKEAFVPLFTLVLGITLLIIQNKIASKELFGASIALFVVCAVSVFVEIVDDWGVK